MANKLLTNPMVLDTFNATATIRLKKIGGITIKKIILFSANSGDVFALEDEDGNPTIIVAQDASLGKCVDFGEGQEFTNGLVFDHDDDLQDGLGSGDYVLIYLK